MTIVDPSHPKAQMAGGSTSADDGESLPSYSQDAPSTAGSAYTEPLFAADSPVEGPLQPIASGSGSYATPPAPALAPFEPESIADLNPEMRKKLADDAQRRGLDVNDYGFAVEPPGEGGELPSFEETDQDERPQYTIDRSGNIVSCVSRARLPL